MVASKKSLGTTELGASSLIKNLVCLRVKVVLFRETEEFGEPEGKRLFDGPRSRWEYNIKFCLGGIACQDVDWIHMAEDSGKLL
jgi:hypothetical protein